MKIPRKTQVMKWIAVMALCAAVPALSSPLQAMELVINEINMSGSLPNQYVEIRGIPGAQIPANTYLVGVTGGADTDPGSVKTIFRLSSMQLGAKGFLVFLQKGNSYAVDPDSATWTGTTTNQFTGIPGAQLSGSSTGAIPNASVTYLLIRTAVAPVLDLDIDDNNDGVPEPGGPFGNWTVLDSVGLVRLEVIDGVYDIGYGRINFVHNVNDAVVPAGSTVVLASAAENYVGRIGNSTGSSAADWVVSSPAGSAPNFTLHNGVTKPALLAGAVLNHVGKANFVTRPDGLIGRRKSKLKGYNRYNNSSAGQNVTTTSTRSRKIRYFWEIQNDGRVRDTISLRGTRGNRKFKAKYFKNDGGNITAQAVRGAYSGEIGIGAKESGRLEVKPKGKGRKTFQLKSASRVDADNRDTTKATALVN